MPTGCPNCGHGLVILREEHQQAGTRHIWLRWLICSACRHVALEDWAFMDEDALDTGVGQEAEQRGRLREC